MAAVEGVRGQMRTVVIHAPHDLRVESRNEAMPGPGEIAVRIARGGICGSDLHYYHHGGFGTVRLREPMILGHEIVGTVAALGDGVQGPAIGSKVAVNPSLPCGACRYCRSGQPHHCLDMRFFGSAMRFPHVHGGFRDMLVCEAERAVAAPEAAALEILAFSEPLAVCLHAVKQAGDLAGRKVLVTGCGPIGALTILAARWAGAIEIVVTDVAAAPLATAIRLGADRAIDVAAEPAALAGYGADKGYFDVVFEASGNGRALEGAIAAARAGATIVQLGLGGDVTLSINAIVAKEIALKGTFRFHEEFGWAVALLASGAIDPRPLLSAVIPVAEAVRAFELAGDRSRAMKVQLDFA